MCPASQLSLSGFLCLYIMKIWNNITTSTHCF